MQTGFCPAAPRHLQRLVVQQSMLNDDMLCSFTAFADDVNDLVRRNTE